MYMCTSAFSAKTKTPPTENHCFHCQGRTAITIRGATLLHRHSGALTRDTDISLTAHVRPTLRHTQHALPLRHTLRGPFAEQFRACIPAPQALCAVLFRRYLRIIGLLTE